MATKTIKSHHVYALDIQDALRNLKAACKPDETGYICNTDIEAAMLELNAAVYGYNEAKAVMLKALYEKQ